MRTLITTFMLLLFTSQAHATLIGDTVNAELKFLSGSSLLLVSDSAVVGGGVEFETFFTGTDKADIGSESITLIYDANQINPVGFSAKRWTFTDLDWLGMSGEIVGVTAAVGNPAGASVFDFGPDSVSIDLPGLVLDGGNVVSWTFELEVRKTSVVPEPLTATLIPLAVAPLLLRRRREA